MKYDVELSGARRIHFEIAYGPFAQENVQTKHSFLLEYLATNAARDRFSI